MDVLAAANYRNVNFLTQFITNTSKILPRKANAVSAKCQRKITREIKKARVLALIPFTSMGDPFPSGSRTGRISNPTRTSNPRMKKPAPQGPAYDFYTLLESGNAKKTR